MKRIISALLLTLLCVASAQAASDLPAAEKLIDKFIQATGGKDALTKYDTAHASGTFSMPAMGISATTEIWQEAPNRTRTTIVSDAFGAMNEGFDGEVAWESNMMTGTKVKDGVELALTRRTADFTPWLNWKKNYRQAQTLSTEDVDGVACYLVEMTPNEGEGEPEKVWFAQDSGLIQKSSLTMKNEMGTISVEAYPSDYREVQGVVMPFLTRQVLMGMQEMVIAIDKYELGVEIPAGTFDLPDEVKALLAESK